MRWSKCRRRGALREVLGAVAVVLFLCACQGMGNLGGGVVPPTKCIQLNRDGSGSGTWQTREVTMTYQYVADGSQMDFRGTVSFATSLTNSFSSIDRFHVKIYWLDGTGRILTTHGLYSSSQFDANDNPSFRTTVPIPTEAVQMAFGDMGQASSYGDQSGVMPFWEVPTSM